MMCKLKNMAMDNFYMAIHSMPGLLHLIPILCFIDYSKREHGKGYKQYNSRTLFSERCQLEQWKWCRKSLER